MSTIHRTLAGPVRCFHLLVPLLVLVACSENDGPPRGVRHPVERFLTYPLKPLATIDLRSSRPGAETTQADRYFDIPAQTVQIGTLDGPRETVFGKVQDLAVDPQGRLYVLDQRYHEVRVFSPSHQFLYSVGRAGRGPGEFYSPRTIAVDRAGRLYVGDIPTVVHVFEPTPDGLHYRETMDVGVEPFDMCTMHDALYINGASMRNTNTLHEFNLEGKRIRSFGKLYESDAPLINFQIAPGHLACIPEERMLAFAPASLLPVVIGYRADGSAAWMSEFSGYKPIVVVEMPNGSAVIPPEDGFNRVEMVSHLPQGLLLVQVATVFPNLQTREARVHELRTFAFSVRSGKGGFLSTDLPRVGVAEHDRFVSVADEPYPSVTIHKLGNSQ